MTVYDNPGNARRGSAPYINPTPPRASDGRFVSGPVAFSWSGLARMQQDLQKKADGLDIKRREAAQSLANDALQFMKAHAPWKDRTGQARQTLMAQVIDNPENHYSDVILGYGVFYGVFLENKTYNGRSYAIIRPTIQIFKARIGEYMA